MKSNHLLLISIILLAACQQKTQTNNLDGTITIDLTETVKSQGPAEEWIEDIQFIPLETKPESFLSSRIRYNLNRDFIVVASDETIHVFQNDGKHLNSFKYHGKGPGEYSMIYDVNFLPDMKEIVVTDPNQNKILCYDFEGNLSCEIKTPFMPTRVAPLANGLFACYRGRLNNPTINNQDLYQIFYLNREGQIISKQLQFSYLMPSTSGGGKFTQSGVEGVYFINPEYGYNIYEVGPGNQLLIKYKFSFGDHNIDTTLLNSERIMKSKQPKQHFGTSMTHLNQLTITSNTISFWGPIIKSEISYGTRQINRKSGHVRFMELDSLSSFGQYSGIPIYFESKSFGGHFIFSIEAIEMREILNKLTPEQTKKLSKSKGFNKLATLNEEDNPVLILYKVKDF